MELLQIKQMQVIEDNYCNVLARITLAEMSFYMRRMKSMLPAIGVYLSCCHNNLISSLRSNQFLLLQSLGERKKGYY